MASKLGLAFDLQPGRVSARTQHAKHRTARIWVVRRTSGSGSGEGLNGLQGDLGRRRCAQRDGECAGFPCSRDDEVARQSGLNNRRRVDPSIREFHQVIPRNLFFPRLDKGREGNAVGVDYLQLQGCGIEETGNPGPDMRLVLIPEEYLDPRPVRTRPESDVVMARASGSFPESPDQETAVGLLVVNMKGGLIAGRTVRRGRVAGIRSRGRQEEGCCEERCGKRTELSGHVTPRCLRSRPSRGRPSAPDPSSCPCQPLSRSGLLPFRRERRPPRRA